MISLYPALQGCITVIGVVPCALTLTLTLRVCGGLRGCHGGERASVRWSCSGTDNFSLSLSSHVLQLVIQHDLEVLYRLEPPVLRVVPKTARTRGLPAVPAAATRNIHPRCRSTDRHTSTQSSTFAHNYAIFRIQRSMRLTSILWIVIILLCCSDLYGLTIVCGSRAVCIPICTPVCLVVSSRLVTVGVLVKRYRRSVCPIRPGVRSVRRGAGIRVVPAL